VNSLVDRPILVTQKRSQVKQEVVRTAWTQKRNFYVSTTAQNECFCWLRDANHAI